MAKTVNIDPLDIIQAARTCIQQKGMAATTLKDVARAAGVTQGTVYYHFKTKEELFSAITRTTVQDLVAKVETAWNSTGDPVSKIDTAIDISLDVYGRDREFHKLFFNLVALGLHNERVAEEFGQVHGTMIKAIEKNCQQVLNLLDKDLQVPPEYLSRVIMSVFTGLALQSVFEPNINLEGVYDVFKQMLRDLVAKNLAGRVEGETAGE